MRDTEIWMYKNYVSIKPIFRYELIEIGFNEFTIPKETFKDVWDKFIENRKHK